MQEPGSWAHLLKICIRLLFLVDGRTSCWSQPWTNHEVPSYFYSKEHLPLYYSGFLKHLMLFPPTQSLPLYLELFHVWRMYPLLMFPASTTVFLWDSAYVEELTSRFKQRQNMFKGEMFWMEVFFSKSKIWVDEWLLMWLSPRLTHFWVLLTHVSKSEKNFMSFSAVH